MKLHLESPSPNVCECWIEVLSPDTVTWEVIAECKVLDSGDTFVVDEIYTKARYRRLGYATRIIRKLQSIKNVVPLVVMDSKEAKAFWSKMNVTLSRTREDQAKYDELAIKYSEFNFRIEE